MSDTTFELLLENACEVLSLEGIEKEQLRDAAIKIGNNSPTSSVAFLWSINMRSYRFLSERGYKTHKEWKSDEISHS